MKVPAPVRSRWTELWTREQHYACPRCGQADTLHLHGLRHNESSTWPCPHCQARLTLLETRKALLFLMLLPFPALIVLGQGLARWQWYLGMLLIVGFTCWARWRLSRMEVRLMPEPLEWT